MLVRDREALHARLLQLAAATVAERGVHALSLREIARQAGVSHAAPVHHFGSREGLLTELAAEGFEALSRALDETPGDVYDKGVAYVKWGTSNAGLYNVMWQTELLDLAHPGLSSARKSAWGHLTTGGDEPERTDALAAFALVHGIVHLALSNTEPALPQEEAALRNLLGRLS